MKKYFDKVKDIKSWKTLAILSGLSFGFLILLDSILFQLAIALLKILFLFSGLVFGGYALYVAYPLIVKKFKELKNR